MAMFTQPYIPPYGDGQFVSEPPSGYGLNITEIFHIVEPKPEDPGINSAVDSQYPNVAIITFDNTNQFGGMWAREKLDLNLPFSTEMYLYIGHQYGKEGPIADGMTFTLQNDSGGIDAIGGAGEGLGVYRGRKWVGPGLETEEHGTFLKNSLVVEFDTYQNSDALVRDPGDPGSSHCALLLPRANEIHIEDHKNVFYFTPPQLWAKFEAGWMPNGVGGGILTYSFNGQQMTYTVNDVISTFGGTSVYWGFTGATGQLTSVQAVAITRLPVQGIITEKTVKNQAGEDINQGAASPGETIYYTIRVTASQVFTAIGPIEIDDELSQYVDYVPDYVQVATSIGGVYSVMSSLDGNIMSVGTNQYLTNEGDWMEITFSVKVKDTAGGKIIYNQAIIAAGGLSEAQETNITEVVITEVDPDPPEKKVADNSAAGKDGSTVTVGDIITYDINFVNYEATPATVIITDVLPAGVDFLTATNDGIYNSATRTVTWTLMNVPSGAQGTVSMTVRVNKTALVSIKNYAAVQVGDNEPQITNIVENPVAPEKVDPEKKVSDSSAAGKDDSAVTVGDIITYDINFVNYEAAPATVIITDVLPAGVDFLTATNGGIYNSATRTVIWTLMNVPSSAQRTVSMTVRVNKTAVVSIKNYATVQVGDNEPQITNVVENPVVISPPICPPQCCPSQCCSCRCCPSQCCSCWCWPSQCCSCRCRCHRR